MERRGFLRSLGFLVGSGLIPADKVLAVTDFVEKKSISPPKYMNHMTIQRRTISVTGRAKTNVIWYEGDAVCGYFKKLDEYAR
jgi:hypothetical protein